MYQNPKILPSLLSAPFSGLVEAIRPLEASGMNLLHFDVMDGHFVPNLTIGPMIIKSLEPYIQSNFDVHLMVTNPNEQVQWFDFTSVRSISIHVETEVPLSKVLHTIRQKNKLAGIVLNPTTPVESLNPYFECVDYVLVMTVNPGFGGQVFLPGTLKKIKQVDQIRQDRNLDFFIQVDGGITAENVVTVREHGADEIVAGHAIFGQPNATEAYQLLDQSIRQLKQL